MSRRKFLAIPGILGSVIGGAFAVFEIELLKGRSSTCVRRGRWRRRSSCDVPALRPVRSSLPL